MSKRAVAAVLALLGTGGGAFFLIPSPPQEIIYGDEVRVRLYRGLGGRVFDRATDGFGLGARLKCGVRYYVESQQGMDEPALDPNGLIRKAKKIIFVGTSMGGAKARNMAAAISPQKSRLLLIDTVPWTHPIPKSVGSDHVVWRGTVPGQLGRARPDGTIDDAQHDRPIFKTHGWLIHSQQVHDEVVAEICRGITKR